MRECWDCGWKGMIDVENMPRDREDYAQHCPGCGRQTIRDEDEVGTGA